MGLTQQKHAVATIQRRRRTCCCCRATIGQTGRGRVPGARAFQRAGRPDDGHLGEDARLRSSPRSDSEFDFTSPRAHGYDAVEAIRAMRDGRVSVFMAMGGNFVSATPDTNVTEAALRNCTLTVQVSTKLNRSHAVTGCTALILPYARAAPTETRASGRQTGSSRVEDSMSVIHLSRGGLKPASQHLRSEVAIVCGLAGALFGSDHAVPWAAFAADYDRIRESISRVVPGFADFNTRVRQPDGFVLPHPPRDERRFATDPGKANFVVNELHWLPVPDGRLILQTMRSHDQYNTTIYGLDDRYRGVKGGRRVIFCHPDDITAAGFREGERVDLVSEWPLADGSTQDRRAEDFRLVGYPTPRGNGAAYYPEINPLIPLDHVALGSNTPVSKAVTIRLERRR